MKSLKLFPFLFLLAACTGGTPKYDATGTFEATEVIVSAEASGKLLSFDIEEGTTLKDGQEVGIIDTVQLYLKKLQLEASVKSVEGQRPDILKQVAATQEQIVQARRERDRVSNLLRVGAANQKQLDDAESLLEVLRKQLDAQNSTLRNSDRSLTWQSSSVGIQVAQIEDQLRKCHITSPLTGTVLAQYAEAGELAAPGMTKEDFNVHIDEENNLVISMEKKTESKEENNKDEKKEGRYLRREFSYTKFQQTMILPDDVDKEKIGAHVENGVLNITLPKFTEAEKEKAKKFIDVK